MGHLGNPVGFRLGLEKKWNFNFFIKNVYYPEYINKLINIRDYVYYYFTRKKILQSGICFSHIFIYKFLKNLYINIYIYHIDLERSSYDFINYLYTNYYTVYNKINFKFVKNKTAKQLDIFLKLRDLSNSDLFVFYYTFVFFYQHCSYNEEHNNQIYLRDNEFIINLKLYSNFIIFNYIKILLIYYKKSIYFKQLIKRKFKQLKLKHNRVKSKLKESKAWFFAKSTLNKLLNMDISFKYRLKFKQLTESQKYWLEKCLTFGLKEKINQVFFSIFFKKKKFKFFRKFKLNKSIFRLRKVVRKSYYDKQFKLNYRKNFNNFIQKKKSNGLNIYNIFVYLAKKTWFEKVKNSKMLWKKWSLIYKHLKILYMAKSLDNKNSLIFNVKKFFFYIHTFIHLSKLGRKKQGIYFNLRNTIYHSIYFGIFYNYFYELFEMLSFLLKINIKLLYSLINENNIIFSYYFITNNNISSQLIARYIGLKLRRGFTVRKTLNPLKRELIRVAKKGWGTQKPYIIYHYKLMYKNKKIFLKKTIKTFMKFCYYFFFINFFKYYINNNLFIFANIFKYIKKKLIKSKKKRVTFFTNFNINYANKVINNIKFRLFNLYNYKKYRRQLKKRKIILFLIKKFYINIMYPLIINYDKKVNTSQLTISRSIFLKNAFLNSLKILNISLYSKIKKKINSKIITISSFLNKNLFHFNVMHSLWLVYKNINIRNIRQKYIPKYYSGIMGFKIVFRGRFSRKERASKMTLNMGKVPLNTLKAKIDYTFLTLPLKNSAISLKIFLYRWPVLNVYKNIVRI